MKGDIRIGGITIRREPSGNIIDIRIGGITIRREPSGNIIIHARGNGEAHVQKADIPDLRLALQELEKLSQVDDGG